MSDFLITLIVDCIALLAVAYIFKGINIKGWGSLVVSALLIALVNAFVAPVLTVLTFPITVVTLGISILFINGLLFYAVSKVVKGFEIKNYWSAFFGALVFSVISILINWVLGRN